MRWVRSSSSKQHATQTKGEGNLSYGAKETRPPAINGSTPVASADHDLLGRIQWFIDHDYDSMQDTRVREFIRRLPVERRVELPGLFAAFRGNEWAQRAIIEGWAAADAPGAIAHLRGQSTAMLRRWEDEIITAWARKEPGAAETWLRGQPLRSDQSAARAALITVLAETDPARALKTLRETGWLHTEPNASLHLLRNWAARDLPGDWRALREIEAELTGKSDMAVAGGPFLHLASSLLDGARFQSPSELKSFLREILVHTTPSMTQQIGRGLLQPRPDFVREMMPEWSTTPGGRGLLVAWAGASPVEALRSLALATDSEVREKMAVAAFYSNHLLASENIQQLGPPKEARAALENALAILPASIAKMMRPTLVEGTSTYAPQLSAGLFTSLTVDDQRACAPGVFSNLTRADLETSRELFDSLPVGPVRDAALPRFCFGLAAKEPAQALTLALTETDNSRRAQAAGLVFATWAAHNSAAAEEALRQAAPQLDLDTVAEAMASAGTVKSRSGSLTIVTGFDTQALQPLLKELQSATRRAQ
jgi:hypothetical protein